MGGEGEGLRVVRNAVIGTGRLKLSPHKITAAKTMLKGLRENMCLLRCQIFTFSLFYF